jgi:hypothetical protein
MTMKYLISAALSLLLGVSAWAQTEGMENMPGYVDFGSLNAIYGEPRVMINLGGPLMQLLTAAAQHSDDPAAAAMMKDLEGVRINVYDTGGNQAPALAQMGEAKAALEAAQWQPFVQVQEEGENVQMFTKVEGDKMQGMAIMVVNEEEAVFLNILGEIDPAQVGRVVDQLNVGVDVGGEDDQ